MRFVHRGAVVAAVIFAAVAVCSGGAQAKTCRLLKYTSFKVSDLPHAVVIPVAIEGTSKKFFVDTGGVVTTLSRTDADALGLRVRAITSGVEFYSVNGTRMTHYAVVDRLGLGPITLRHMQVLLTPPHAVGKDAFAGTIAPDLLRNFDLDFAFGTKTLTLFSPDHCEGKVVYWAAHYGTVPFKIGADRAHIEVPVTLDGHTFTADLDTGSSFSAINERMARSAFGLKDGDARLSPVEGTSGRAFFKDYAHFKSLTLGDVTVNNPALLIMPDAAVQAYHRHHHDKTDMDPIYGSQLQRTEMILGLDILTKLHLYIAYGEKTLYVTAAGAGQPPAAK